MSKKLDPDAINELLSRSITPGGCIILNGDPAAYDILTKTFDAAFPDTKKLMVITGHNGDNYIGASNKIHDFIYFKLIDGKIVVDIKSPKAGADLVRIFECEMSNPNIIEDIKKVYGEYAEMEPSP
jgi:hypothetical protein